MQYRFAKWLLIPTFLMMFGCQNRNDIELREGADGSKVYLDHRYGKLYNDYNGDNKLDRVRSNICNGFIDYGLWDNLNPPDPKYGNFLRQSEEGNKLQAEFDKVVLNYEKQEAEKSTK